MKRLESLIENDFTRLTNDNTYILLNESYYSRNILFIRNLLNYKRKR